MLLILFLLPAVAVAEWPAWRGPGHNGVASGPPVPLQWSPTQNIAWKTAIPGRGHSSPVIWGDRVFLTTAIEAESKDPQAHPVRHKLSGEDPFIHPDAVGADRQYTLNVLCLDTSTGKILWQRTAFQGRVFDSRHKKASFASPTPTTDGRFVYVSFESQGIFAYDFNGNLAWKTSVGGVATLGLGAGASPVLFENKLILLCDQDGGENSFLIALSTKDGSVVWKTPRTERVSWTTPLLLPGRAQLAVPGADQTSVYDARTGKQLWTAPGLGGWAVPTAVADRDMLFVVGGHPDKRAYGIRLNSEDRLAWKYEKGTPYVASPVLLRGVLHFTNDRGMVTAIEAASGKVLYEGKRLPEGGWFWASLAAFEDKILLTSEEGDYYWIRAGAKFEILGKNSLGEPAYASPAFHGGSLYLRTLHHLYRIADR